MKKGWFKKAKAKLNSNIERQAQYNAKSKNRKMRKDLGKD